jgi:hypothetical protein
MAQNYLDKFFFIRTDKRWKAWLEELARETDRTPSAFIRDLVFCLKVTPQGKQAVETLNKRDLNYSKFTRNAKLAGEG